MKRPKGPRCPIQDKDSYPTQADAISVALKRATRGGRPLRPYLHDECGWWHVTKLRRYARAEDPSAA